jgi:preprotein translocase subunit SecG
MDRAFDVAGLLVVAAIITTIVAHPESKGIITAFGGAFNNSLVAAEGSGKTVN